MKAIVYSEVAQMIIKVLGIFIIIYYGLKQIGGWDIFLQNVDTKRLEVLRFRNSGFDNQEFGFWPMLFGGIFLYCAYYGTDQSQVQRILSAKDEKTVKKLLLFNGLFRFPITLSYCFGGLILGTLVSLNGDFASKIPVEKPDLMIPVFITNYLPHGIIGVIIVAIIAAAMSAYSSNINSLAAVTMEDFVSKKVTVPAEKYVTYSKLAALVWGLITLVLAFFMGDIAKTVIEAINKIGSVFYGPVVCMFLLAIFTKNIQAKSANTGVIFGVLLNLILWIFFKNIFWFWWNVIGAVTTLLVAVFCHYFVYKTVSVQNTYVVENPSFKTALFTKETGILFVYFILIFSFCYYLTSLV
jgi:Na+/proline symporter